ncbi:MAG TPA: hypothetical protein V6D08_15075, partial [Candidatus Obscuribacterales bacterium]
SSDLKGLTRADRRRAFTRALQRSRPVDSASRVGQLRAEIAAFEKRFGMTTADMLSRVCAGDLKDDGDIAVWSKKYLVLCAHEENVRASTGT